MNGKKWIFLLVMALLLAGGLGALHYTEQRVENSVREFLQQILPACTVGQVRFSAWHRTLSVEDIAYVQPQGSIRIEQAEMVLPLHMFFDLPDTEVELLESLVLRQMQVVADRVVLSEEERKYIHISANPGELLRYLEKNQGTSLVGYGVLQRLSFAAGTARNIGMRIEMADGSLPLSCTMERSSEGPYRRGLLEQFQIHALQLRQGEYVLATLDSFHGYAMRLPSEEAVMALVKSLQEMAEEERAVRPGAVVDGILSVASPLVEHMILDGFQMTAFHQPVGVQKMELWWSSGTSGALRLHAVDLSVPVRLFAELYRPLQCPGLDILHLTLDMRRMAGARPGQERYILNVQARDVGMAKVDLTLADSFSRTEGGDPLLEMMMSPIAALELHMEDQVLSAYLAGNMGGEPAVVAVDLPKLLERYAVQLLGDRLSAEEWQRMREFLRNPGELSLHFRPKEPVTLLDMMFGASDWRSQLQLEMKSGKEPLVSRVQRIFGSVAP